MDTAFKSNGIAAKYHRSHTTRGPRSVPHLQLVEGRARRLVIRDEYGPGSARGEQERIPLVCSSETCARKASRHDPNDRQRHIIARAANVTDAHAQTAVGSFRTFGHPRKSAAHRI